MDKSRPDGLDDFLELVRAARSEAMEPPRCGDLYSLLQDVRKHPNIYFIDKNSLELMEDFIRGYGFALEAHGVNEFGTYFYRLFPAFLGGRYGWRDCRPWSRMLNDRYATKEEAFNRFFELVDEFHDLYGSP